MSAKMICYSGAPSKSKPHRLGTQHYSYRFAEQKFLACLQTMDLETHFIQMPEYYFSLKSYLDLPLYEDRHIHLIFRSTEEIRILKNGYNIACYAWEFPHLKDTTGEGEHPFLNQKRMLQLCEEIWVPCEYSRNVLVAHGIENVHTIPAPIFEAGKQLPRVDALTHLGHLEMRPFFVNFLGSSSSGRSDKTIPLFAAVQEAGSDAKIFLSVFNPEDFRKNLDALVRGFDAFQQRAGRNDLLVIKALTSRDRFTLEQVVRDVMLRKLDRGSVLENDNILVFNELLNDEQMNALYDLADFYLCTSIAEGQNLPLQEAMIRGVVPVTTCNTAMLDYIDSSNAVVVETTRVRNSNPHLAGNMAGKPYEIDLCSSRQVARALMAAVDLDEEAYRTMSREARTRIEQNYTRHRVGRLIDERLRSIAPAAKSTDRSAASRFSLRRR